MTGRSGVWCEVRESGGRCRFRAKARGNGEPGRAGARSRAGDVTRLISRQARHALLAAAVARGPAGNRC